MPTLIDTFKQLGPLDYGFIAVIALSMLFGLVRGFVQVVMSLAGWLVALLGAHYLAHYLAPYLNSTGLGETPKYALAFFLVFVIVLVMWGIFTLVIKSAVNSAGLGGLDRLLGGIAGAARGVVMTVYAAVLVSLTPIDQTQTWQASSAVKLAKSTAQSIKSLLPSKVSAFIPESR